MIAFPNCKINLGLNILRKREDNFHDLETLFFPVPLYDIIEIVSAADGITSLKVTGFSAGKPEDNLCTKAYHLLKKDFVRLPAVTIHLHKAIPVGSGLGAGSADAAFTLHLLKEKYALKIPEEKIFGYALQLGSDCPFFLLNKPCIATSRGEVLEPVNISLSGYTIVLINPGIHVNTREAFKEIQPVIPAKKIKEIITQKIETWKDELINDFEKPVFKKYPQIKTIKETLYKSGAIYASMSGSGSTVYGIFKNDVMLNYLNKPLPYFYKVLPIP